MGIPWPLHGARMLHNWKAARHTAHAAHPTRRPAPAPLDSARVQSCADANGSSILRCAWIVPPAQLAPSCTQSTIFSLPLVSVLFWRWFTLWPSSTAFARQRQQPALASKTQFLVFALAHHPFVKPSFEPSLCVFSIARSAVFKAFWDRGRLTLGVAGRCAH